MRTTSFFLTALLGLSELAATGCLTTPASATGGSKRARQLTPHDCGPDALIEDGEDGDNRVLQRDGRGGYWFTSIDAAGSVMQPMGDFKMGSPGRNGPSGSSASAR